MRRHGEAFVGIDTAKARNAVAIAEGGRNGEVRVLRENEAAGPNVAIISYDEKPGIQAVGSTASDLPPQPGSYPSWARDHEYKRHGTLSLLAGIDLLTGKVHASVETRHRSREFVGFLKKLDIAYPMDTAIKLILDNHSAHCQSALKGDPLSACKRDPGGWGRRGLTGVDGVGVRTWRGRFRKAALA